MSFDSDLISFYVSTGIAGLLFLTLLIKRSVSERFRNVLSEVVGYALGMVFAAVCAAVGILLPLYSLVRFVKWAWMN